MTTRACTFVRVSILSPWVITLVVTLSMIIIVVQHLSYNSRSAVPCIYWVFQCARVSEWVSPCIKGVEEHIYRTYIMWHTLKYLQYLSLQKLICGTKLSSAQFQLQLRETGWAVQNTCTACTYKNMIAHLFFFHSAMQEHNCHYYKALFPGLSFIILCLTPTS